MTKWLESDEKILTNMVEDGIDRKDSYEIQFKKPYPSIMRHAEKLGLVMPQMQRKVMEKREKRVLPLKGKRGRPKVSTATEIETLLDHQEERKKDISKNMLRDFYGPAYVPGVNLLQTHKTIPGYITDIEKPLISLIRESLPDHVFKAILLKALS